MVLWSLSFPFFTMIQMLLQPSVLWLCALFVHLYPCFCLQCITFGVCEYVCSCFIFLSAPPCTVACSSSPLFASPFMLGSLKQELAGSVCHLLRRRGTQTVRCTNTGSAAFLIHAPAGSLSGSSVLFSRHVPLSVITP